MSRPKIKITLIDRKGKHGCHRGHKIGDSFDFDTERGQLCPMAMHVAFPYIDILRYGGHLPGQEDGTAVALVTYGGRAYDNALAEMCELLTKNNFKPAAGGAFLCRHVFSDKLAAGRPDAADLGELRMLAQSAALKLRSEGEIKPPKVPGDAQAAYYTPLKTDKTPAKFLKAKPTTAMVLCEHCGLCAKICPMGAIDPNDPSNIPGTCIKCCACTTYCPSGAKKFDDPDFLSHTAMLEKFWTESRKENAVFL